MCLCTHRTLLIRMLTKSGWWIFIYLCRLNSTWYRISRGRVRLFCVIGQQLLTEIVARSEIVPRRFAHIKARPPASPSPRPNPSDDVIEITSCCCPLDLVGCCSSRFICRRCLSYRKTWRSYTVGRRKHSIDYFGKEPSIQYWELLSQSLFELF